MWLLRELLFSPLDSPPPPWDHDKDSSLVFSCRFLSILLMPILPLVCVCVEGWIPFARLVERVFQLGMLLELVCSASALPHDVVALAVVPLMAYHAFRRSARASPPPPPPPPPSPYHVDSGDQATRRARRLMEWLVLIELLVRATAGLVQAVLHPDGARERLPGEESRDGWELGRVVLWASWLLAVLRYLLVVNSTRLVVDEGGRVLRLWARGGVIILLLLSGVWGLCPAPLMLLSALVFHPPIGYGVGDLPEHLLFSLCAWCLVHLWARAALPRVVGAVW